MNTYDEDAGDRIVAALEHLEIPARDRLAAAAVMAGRQLELQMPVVFGDVARGRMIAGKFTAAAPGTVLIAIANSDSVATVHVPEQSGLADQLISRAQGLRRYLTEHSVADMRGATATVLDMFVREYGGAPGAVTTPASALIAGNTIAAMFAPMPDEQTREVIGSALEVADAGYCPAIIALVTPGRKPRAISGCWPLLMHLAPYLDTALLDAAEVEGCA